MAYEFVRAILEEDIGRGDLYSKVAVPKAYLAKIVSNQNGILAGVKYAKIVSEILNFTIEFIKQDGDLIVAGDILATIDGYDVDVLIGERVMLNLLQHASGISTKTKALSDMSAPAQLLDTRKTRPLLRKFEKYATQIGGATNHRFGLDDCLMIKDTHKKAIDNLEIFIKNARIKLPFTINIEIECETYNEAINAMRCGADIVMCDNMHVNEVLKVVEFRNTNFIQTKLEASGNINETNIALYAKTGVDAISIGAITHQATWLDFSMKAY